MLFVSVRIIFWSVAFIVCFFLIKKSRIVHKRKWYIIALIAAVILTVVSALIPIENAFITFSSPEATYNYTHSGEVSLVVNGEKTDFVIGKNGDTDVYAIIPKSGNGWKLGMGSDTKKVIQTLSDGITVCVYQYKNSGDCYITVLDTNGGASEVSDNHNSEFYYLDKTNSTLNKTFYTYYAYINEFDDRYTLIVNGNTIRLQNGK